MPTLAVGGCSFSDYCKVLRPYGVVLAEKLGYNYLHLAQGCGSNDRVIKEVVDAITNGKLVSGDLVIIQWPEPTRQEVPTLLNDVEQRRKDHGPAVPGDLPLIRESNLGDYVYYNFKIGLPAYKNVNPNDFQQVMMSKYISALESVTAENELFFLHKWQVYHTLIESICQLNNIKLLIYWHRAINIWEKMAEQIIGNKCSTLMYTDKNMEDEHIHSEESWQNIMLGYDSITGELDLSHYNDFGHSLVAEYLFNHYLKIKEQL